GSVKTHAGQRTLPLFDLACQALTTQAAQQAGYQAACSPRSTAWVREGQQAGHLQPGDPTGSACCFSPPSRASPHSSPRGASMPGRPTSSSQTQSHYSLTMRADPQPSRAADWWPAAYARFQPLALSSFLGGLTGFPGTGGRRATSGGAGAAGGWGGVRPAIATRSIQGSRRAAGLGCSHSSTTTPAWPDRTRTWVWTKTGTKTDGAPSHAWTGLSWRSQQPVLTITVSRPSARLSSDMAGVLGCAGANTPISPGRAVPAPCGRPACAPGRPRPP